MQTTTLSFYRFEGLAQKSWAFGQMQFARGPLARTPDIGFHKQFGTGTGLGFNPRPNWGVYAILAVWPSMDAARSALSHGKVFVAYRHHAAETFEVYLNTLTARGVWDGRAPFDAPDEMVECQPIGILTRASIKPRHLRSFWAHVPDVSNALEQHSDLVFTSGMGEIPWLHQVTFSVWPSAKAMSAFAYQAGHHRDAMRQAHDKGWFNEDLFARFRIVEAKGTWGGREILEAAAIHPVAKSPSR